MTTLTFTQVKKLKRPNDKKFKSFSIDSNCGLYLVCFNTGTKLYSFDLIKPLLSIQLLLSLDIFKICYADK